MAMETNRNRPRAARLSSPPDDRPAARESGDLDFDMTSAIVAGDRADSELIAAQKKMKGISAAAADAQEALYRALRAAEYAEEAAGWVLEDARRMMAAARARAEKVRAMFRTDGNVVEDFDGGERAIDQAGQGEVRAIEASMRAVEQAMRAASQAQRREPAG